MAWAAATRSAAGKSMGKIGLRLKLHHVHRTRATNPGLVFSVIDDGAAAVSRTGGKKTVTEVPVGRAIAPPSRLSGGKTAAGDGRQNRAG